MRVSVRVRVRVRVRLRLRVRVRVRVRVRRTSPRLEWQSEQFALRRSPHSKSCSACLGDIGLQPAAAQRCSQHTYGYGREHTGLQAPLHGAHGVAVIRLQAPLHGAHGVAV